MFLHLSLISNRMITYFSRCSNTCWNQHFPVPNGTMKCLNHVTLGCSLSCPTFWEISGFVLPNCIVFGESFTRTWVCFLFNRCSFGYCVNMSLLMCGSKGRHLVISSSYHTIFLSIIGSCFYITTYLSWLATSYSCTPFTMSMWSYHWWSKYPFALVPLWEWTYNNPWHTLGYCCSYCFGERNTCSKGGLTPFFSPHSMTSEHFYYQRWLPYLDVHCHYWPHSHKYGARNIDDDNTCMTMVVQEKTQSYSKRTPYDDFIPVAIETYGCFHFRFNSFLISFAHTIVTRHQTYFFNPFDAHFPLLIRCVHIHVTCASHNNSLVGCYI